MKRSFLCVLLALCFVLPLTISPTSALAEEDEAVLVEQADSEIAEAPAEQESDYIEESPAVEQEEEMPDDPDYPEILKLEVGKRTILDPELQNMEFTPQESGDYQFYFEPMEEGDDFYFMIGSISPPNENGPLCMMGTKNKRNYDNFYMKAGLRYGFYTSGCVAVTVVKDSIPQIEEGVQTPGEAGNHAVLNLFIPKERGRYVFTRTGFSAKPERDSFTIGVASTMKYYYQFDNENSWEMVLEAGERCYIGSRNAKYIKVERTGFSNVSQDIERAYLLEERWDFPWGKDEGDVSRFTIDNTKAVMKGYSRLEKPWIAVVPKSETAVPVLRDRSGKVIEWQVKELDGYDRMVYMAPVSTQGGARRFSLSILPENGNEAGAKKYSVYVNPVVKKPGRPLIKKCTIKAGIPFVEWKNATGATGYYVYRSKSAKGGFGKIATLDRGTITSFEDKSAEPGETYYYKIVAYTKGNGKTCRSDSSKAVKAQ